MPTKTQDVKNAILLLVILQKTISIQRFEKRFQKLMGAEVHTRQLRENQEKNQLDLQLRSPTILQKQPVDMAKQ